MILLNLFFLTIPLLRGSKSLKYSLYLSLLIFEVLLSSSKIDSTSVGKFFRWPVPCLKVSLISVMYAKSYGLVSFKKSRYLTSLYFSSSDAYNLQMALFSYSERLNPTVAKTCLNCFWDTLSLLSLSQFSKSCFTSSLFDNWNSLQFYLIRLAVSSSCSVIAFFP